MKLYLLLNPNPPAPNTYTSAVVAAEDLLAAKMTHPKEFNGTTFIDRHPKWPDAPHKINARFLGYAKRGQPAGVLCVNYND